MSRVLDAGVAHSDQSFSVIGLMSGTSLDGIDGVCVAIRRKPDVADGCAGSLSVTIMDSASVSLPEDLRRSFIDIQTAQSVSMVEFVSLQAQWTELAIQVVQQLQSKCSQPVAAIGCHGQTVYHQPPSQDGLVAGYSWQWGNAAQLAAACGIPVVSDFRNGDMAIGGQGAPLVPFVQALLWGHRQPTPSFLNLGGIANLTLLPQQPPLQQPVWAWPAVLGFDTGPANMLLDRAMQRWGQQSYDASGVLASEGTVHDAALAWALSHPYFSLSPPKSTGREVFNDAFLDDVLAKMDLTDPLSASSLSDVLATLVAVTVQSVACRLPTVTDESRTPCVWVSGGGVHNVTLFNALRNACKEKGYVVDPLSSECELGVGPTHMEAMAFAVLAWCRLHGWPAQCASATGATCATPLGSVVLPPSKPA